MQTRLFDYGASITAAKINQLTSTLINPCMLSGGQFYVPIGAPTYLGIQPYSLVLPQGVVVVEDQPQEQLQITGADALNYTIVCSYDTSTQFIGGSLATILTIPGILPQSAIITGTVMGWITYPGNNVALTTEMFAQPLGIQINVQANLDDLQPTLGADWSQSFIAESVTAITYTQKLDNGLYFDFTNNTASNITASYYCPVVATSALFGSVYTNIQTGTAQVAFEIVTPNTIVTPINNILTGIVSMTPQLMLITPGDYSNFTATSQYLLRVTFYVPPNQEIKISAIGVSSNTFPFLP